jgi:tetratricopeptide (TPR) repeat protein
VLGPVTCAACGAKVREDRARCLRCGAPMRPQPAPPRRVSTSTLGIVAGIVAVGGLVTWLMVDSAPEAAPAAPVVRQAAAAPAAADRPESTVWEPSRRADQERFFDSMEDSRRGPAAYNRGDLTASVEPFRAAVEADPENADALNNYGQVLVRTGRPRDAIPYFDRAIAASADVWGYHFNRARAYAQVQEWREAIAGYREAARLFPEDYVTQFNLAKALEANGELAPASEAYARAIALAPSEPDFHLSHAHVLELAKRPAEAVAAYQRYLELQENAPQAEKIKARIAALTAAASGPRIAQ